MKSNKWWWLIAIFFVCLFALSTFFQCSSSYLYESSRNVERDDDIYCDLAFKKLTLPYTGNRTDYEISKKIALYPLAKIDEVFKKVDILQRGNC